MRIRVSLLCSSIACDEIWNIRSIDILTGWDEIIKQRVISYMCCGGLIIFAKDPYGRYGKKADMILHKRKTVNDVEKENKTSNALLKMWEWKKNVKVCSVKLKVCLTI